MGGVGVVFIVLYFAVIFGVVIFLLVLLSRFVQAHQRCAGALEAIARKLPDSNEAL
jgi:hypothetical protein